MTGPVTRTATGLETGFPVERFTLDNGLRVVVSPDHQAPVVGVAVVYDVGVRAERPGRSGFAHLFEHLMFHGPRHARQIQGAGGSFGGSTHADFTVYRQTLPVRALERALFLEAERMRGPVLTDAELRSQVEVVKQETRTKLRNRPYGGFPWRHLPPVMFSRFPNTHDGLGSFGDLDAATVAEAAGFFQTWYPPGNAVLVVVGDAPPDRVRTLVERHFGDLPARPVPARPELAEPDLTAPRHGSYPDRLAPLPAVAMGWRVPDPIGEFGTYLPYVVLADLLTGGPASRLARRLVLRDRSATSLRGHLGFTDEPFGARDPTALVLRAYLPAGGSVARVLDAVDQELDRLGAAGPEPGELARTRVRVAAGLLRDTDPVLGRGLTMAVLELQRGQPGLVNRLPGLVESVTAEQLAAATATLRRDRRASVEVVPDPRPAG